MLTNVAAPGWGKDDAGVGLAPVILERAEEKI
jgi:hypothetical protein